VHAALAQGNCIILSLDFWFTPEVQDFVRLCIMSGGAYKLRWNDQAVMTFVWLVFVPSNSFMRTEFSFAHPDGSAGPIMSSMQCSKPELPPSR
jgi:hypothetical protein